jgi:ABC-2 type transport system ATP-binding protein
MQSPVIEIKNLERSFGDVIAVKGLNLSIKRGTFFGLIGPDGAGKSTTIRLLCGILKPTEGEGKILGFDLRKNGEAIKARIGYLSQAFTLYGDLTVDENIEFFADLHGVDNFKKRRDELLAFTRLDPFHKRLAGVLSGGMKKKLALACALIHTPEILFLDEPSTGVDPVSRGEFWTILKALLEQNITILMTTPYLDEAERCHQIALMIAGKIIRVDTPTAVKDDLRGRMYSIIGGSSLQELHQILKQRWPPTALVRYGDRLHFFAARSDAEITEAQAWLSQNGQTGLQFQPIEPSLEDVFVSLMSKPQEGSNP